MKKSLLIILIFPLVFLCGCSRKIETKVYFGNSNFNPDSVDCSQVYPVSRNFSVNSDLPRLAFEELLKGPNQAEKGLGYTSWFSDKTGGALKNFSVSNGLARVDLIDLRPIIPNASASCGSTQLLAEMESTLKQFPEITKVIFSINGDAPTFYEWLQLSSPNI